jgi:hypothetical protein
MTFGEQLRFVGHAAHVYMIVAIEVRAPIRGMQLAAQRR